MVKYLVKQGADVNANGSFGDTPLMIACEKGHLKIAKYLVKNGADVNAEDCFNKKPLIIASGKGYLKILKYLTKNSADGGPQIASITSSCCLI